MARPWPPHLEHAVVAGGLVAGFEDAVFDGAFGVELAVDAEMGCRR